MAGGDDRSRTRDWSVQTTRVPVSTTSPVAHDGIEPSATLYESVVLATKPMCVVPDAGFEPAQSLPSKGSAFTNLTTRAGTS